MKELKVISFNFDNNPEAGKLIESAKRFDYDLEFVGQGVGFTNFRQSKIDLLLEELKKIENPYVMFTDGLDSWFLRNDILEKFLLFKSEIVVSGNRDHYPSTDLYKLEEYPESPTSFRYICSSQFIGKTEFLIKFIETMQKEYLGFTCQEGWNYMAIKYQGSFQIDYNCELFLNMTNVQNSELDENFMLKETGNIPCSIHYGGPKGNSPNGLAMAEMWQKYVAKG